MLTRGDVDHLGPGSTGRWFIHSQESIHVLDLDAGTYERRPGPTSEPFAYDHTPVTIGRIEVWPRVGGRMLIWFDDPDTPHLLEHFRLCSRIWAIGRDEPSADRDTHQAAD